jgi:hypothetical protein
MLGIALAAGCYHKDPGPVPYAAAEGPARIARIPGALADTASIEVAIRAGSAHDPAGREGLAWLTAELVRHGGTRAMDPDAFDQALADLGAEITVEVGAELVRFRAVGPAANGAAIEALLGAMVSEPRFDDSAFPIAVERATSAVAAREAATTPALAAEAVRLWVFRGHPYGHLVEGRSGTLPTIRAAEVRHFYAERYVRAATVGCVVGDAPAGEPLGAALTTLPPRLYEDVTPRIVEPVDGLRVLWLEAHGSDASVQLGRPLELVSGEGGEAWVAMKALEESLRGSIDGTVRVGLDPDLEGGTVQPMIRVSVDTTPDRVAAALKALFDTLAAPPEGLPDRERLHAEGVAERTAARASDACGAAFVSSLVPGSVDLMDPIDETVLRTLMGRVWNADGWKVLVVTPGAAGIAQSLREGNPTPPVYAAASASDAISTDVLFR